MVTPRDWFVLQTSGGPWFAVRTASPPPCLDRPGVVSRKIRRIKNSTPSVRPLRGDELRALRELQRQCPDSRYVFCTERGGPFTADVINRLVKGIGKRAGLPFPPVHIHMPRHGRLRAGERGARHAAHPKLAWSSEYSAHGSLYRVEQRAVQRLLALKQTAPDMSGNPDMSDRSEPDDGDADAIERIEANGGPSARPNASARRVSCSRCPSCRRWGLTLNRLSAI